MAKDINLQIHEVQRNQNKNKFKEIHNQTDQNQNTEESRQKKKILESSLGKIMHYILQSNNSNMGFASETILYT